MNRGRARFIAFMLMVAIIIAAMVIPLPSFSGFLSASPTRETAQIVESIENMLVQCYALEGAYPPNLEYLAAHYGLRMDRENYFYHYEVYAANLRPTINVIRITE